MDRDLFSNWIGELDDHFPGERSPRITRIYYQELKDRLDDEAFEAACVQIVRKREYFPPIDAFLDSAPTADGVPPPEVRASEQAERVRHLMRDWRRAEPGEHLDEVGVRALRAVGGIKELALLPRDQANWRLKQFRQEYVALATGAAVRGQTGEALPPMTEEGRELMDDAMNGRLAPPPPPDEDEQAS